MGWAPRAELVVDDEYDPEKDVEFYEQPERFTPVEVPAGRFCIFLPGDGHEPLIRMGDDRHVRKVVIKARLAALYPARA
jgi:YhcH/YjgK/YiaL family protein